MVEVNAREQALKVLKEVDEDGAYANLALDKILEKHELKKLDRAFITELTYGTLKRLNTLDWLLSRFLKKPLAAQTVWVRNILRMAAYQVFFMERVPNAAACNEGVELAKKYSHKGVVGFVNGVLRNLVREIDNIEFPDINCDPATHISLKYSHPSWLVQKWLEDYGIELTIKLCKANNEVPPNTVRVNTLKIDRDSLISRLKAEGVEATRTKYSSDGLSISGFLSYRTLPSFKEGLFQVQDESSMLAALVLNPAHGSRVIDCAAAPGGKTTHIAQLMENTGEIHAFDLHPHKLDLIKQNCIRLGVKNVTCHAQDIRTLSEEWNEYADYVLLDAPCSGLGVLRRRPDARWRKEFKQIKALVKLQREMLDRAAKLVRPGGVLVYSTCTITEEENIFQIKSFLKRNTDFISEDLTPFLPPDLREERGVKEGFIQLCPHKYYTDGFFIARLRKKKVSL
ncbi:16S rRNA (cytosine(967)-C(5))-methyltransferase RsmB [Peptococcaceae bacterium]|nr:16S rRNA (cytosine(967)-C(5))-methyltransferase RsmB [Peptococcaceae bacterium]MCL0106309.1 16S rRNA (cytosine(967)-C(5))-methyltransferase RsmB [Peptococcaceae bacterium]